jgi:hypothetical protein
VDRRFELPPELEAAAERAAKFAESRELNDLFREAAADESLWAEASGDPEGFLRERGVDVPEGLGVGFVQRFGQSGPFKPVPDYEFFTIRFTRCRRFWVKKRDGPGYEQVEVCFGFEVVPHPLPGGPIA